jgi:hypothetical protein
MDSLRIDRFTRSCSAVQTRRGALRALLGAGAAGVMALPLAGEDAAAFRSVSGCKQHCERFEGDCRSRCNTCCDRVIGGNQNRCNFGCGSVRTKKKKKK